MKKLFWIGLAGLLAFELANVYFIMPMPGSQQMNSIDLAYFLYQWRWAFRLGFGALLLLGWWKGAWRPRAKRWLLVPVLVFGAVAWMANFKMAADAMFRQPHQLVMASVADNKIDSNRLVIGVSAGDESRAYPIQLIGYHHYIQDSIAGKRILVTYCTVCRTGRVYEPLVNGEPEQFRLVGMDHFNAMLEDAGTGSWWRQVTGEAIAGKLKGQQLPEFPSMQTSLKNWLRLNPGSRIMQADPSYADVYSKTFDYETGKSRTSLTGTDSLSWKRKSWVVGVKLGNQRRAYDWNQLRTEKLIQDQIGNIPILIVMTADSTGFYAFQRPDTNARFTLNRDTLAWNQYHFRVDGKGIDTSLHLIKLPAYQEFWHSWQTFNPGTTKY